MMKMYTEERYLQFVNSTNDLNKLCEMLGVGYSEMKVASSIVTLAKKGKINKIKATMLLRTQPQMIKFLSDKVKATKLTKNRKIAKKQN